MFSHNNNNNEQCGTSHSDKYKDNSSNGNARIGGRVVIVSNAANAFITVDDSRDHSGWSRRFDRHASNATVRQWQRQQLRRIEDGQCSATGSAVRENLAQESHQRIVAKISWDQSEQQR